MHQLLIIDDQSVLADDLADMLPWHTAGIDAVHKAYSAQEALQLMEEHAIDVVLTDIRMPGMSGLELIRQIKLNGKHTKCILLSGYSDFEYTRQAMQLRSSDYLLKPVADDEVLAAVGRAVEELDREWLEISSMQRAMYSLREQLPKLREYLLLDLLSGKHGMAGASLLRKLEMYEVPFRPGEAYHLLLMRLEPASDGEADPERSELLDYALTNMAQEIFADKFDLWPCQDQHGYIVCLLREREQPDSEAAESAKPLLDLLEQGARNLQHITELYLKRGLSLLLSAPGQFPADVNASYHAALADFRRLIGDDRDLLVLTSPARRQPPAPTLGELYRSPTLLTLLEVGQWDEAEEKLKNVFGELEGLASGEARDYVAEAYFTIAAAVASVCHKNRQALSAAAGTDLYALANGHAVRTLEELRYWSLRTLHNLRTSFHQEEKSSRSSLIRQVQAYVQEHLAEATLSSIAASVYLNPSYLSKIYKLETGEGISEYLLQARMEKAASLLRDSTERIYDISEKLGYQKPSYFIQLFKKSFGMTPQEYRNAAI